jgi:hypothetical protein
MDGLNPRQRCIWFGLAFLACATIVRAQVAPPPAPPVISAAPFSIETTESTTAQLYSIGDPTNEEQYYLERRDANGILLASNDNWRSTQQTAIIATGVAPTGDAESAIVATFSPGSYTAIVRGADGTTGVAVVEVYQLN